MGRRNFNRICGIYKITSPSGRIYVGQSIDIKTRFISYRNFECKNQHRLKSSFKKYGVDNHIFEIILECAEDELNDKEIYFISLLKCTTKSGLNISIGGSGVMRNRKHSDETKDKIRISKIGLKASIDTKLKMSQSRLKWKHTESSKLKMSQSSKKTKIINVETGEIHVGYDSILKNESIKRTTLIAQLKGQNKNKTKYKIL